MPKLTIILGSGSTRAQARAQTPKNRQPPLDQGFYSQLRKPETGHRLYLAVKSYLQKQYHYDITDPKLDSFEAVASILYADAFAPRTQSVAYPVFLGLLQYLSRRLALTINPLVPNRRNVLQRILRTSITKFGADNVSIVTFNYDLQAERALLNISGTAQMASVAIFKFPGCYRLQNPNAQRMGRRTHLIPSRKLDDSHDGVPILKLHGSANWYSFYKDNPPDPDVFLSGGGSRFLVANIGLIPNTGPVTATTRKKQATSVKGKGAAKGPPRTWYGFPLIVPPVPHKSASFHSQIKSLWTQAADLLSDADELLVFGYSCPAQDQEAANLIRSTAGRNSDLNHVTIVDPNPSIATRFVELAGVSACSWFHDAGEYLKAARDSPQI